MLSREERLPCLGERRELWIARHAPPARAPMSDPPSRPGMKQNAGSGGPEDFSSDVTCARTSSPPAPLERVPSVVEELG